MPVTDAIPSASRLNIPRYSGLLKRFAPKVIETKEENRRAVKAIGELMEIADPTPEEIALLDLLGTLVDRFEREAYPVKESSPREILAFLIEENGLKAADLAGIMGGRSRVSDVLSGKREISKEQAKRLAERFRVSAGLFI